MSMIQTRGYGNIASSFFRENYTCLYEEKLILKGDLYYDT